MGRALIASIKASREVFAGCAGELVQDGVADEFGDLGDNGVAVSAQPRGKPIAQA